MSWAEVAIVFFVCHLTGDYLLQTDWQAKHKMRGLSRDRVARRALYSHVTVYTLAFVPALVWIAGDAGAAVALAAAGIVFIPHLLVDDGRAVAAYVRGVKRCPDPAPGGVVAAVDQSIHLLCLWATALLVAGMA